MRSPAPLLAFPPSGSLYRDLVLGMLSVKLSQRRWWEYFTCDSLPPLILHQQQLRLLSVSLAACLRLTKGAIKVLFQKKAPLRFSTSHKLLGMGKVVLPGTSASWSLGHNFIGKAQESGVSLPALSLLEPSYITLEPQN